MKVFWILAGVLLSGWIGWNLWEGRCGCSPLGKRLLGGGLVHSSRNHPNERCSSSSLKTLSSAQADFRANDRDGDGIANFWKVDVAGLYVTAHRTDPSGQPIKLIELSLAAADASPVTKVTPFASRGPKSGYWYQAIPHADEAKPDPNRFAFCAWPDNPSAGKYVFVVDENNTIFRGPATGRGGVRTFPTDAELRQFWSKID